MVNIMSENQNNAEWKCLEDVVAALKPLDASTRLKIIKTAMIFMEMDPEAIASSQREKANPPKDELDGAVKLESTFKDIRTLRDEKQPKSDMQMAVIVAYYLSEIAVGDERKVTITADDITRLFKQAQHKIPPNANKTLHNAKNAGYLEQVGSGEFKLNPVGYNLVVHTLPSDGAAPRVVTKKRQAKKAAKPHKPKSAPPAKGSQKHPANKAR